VLLPTLSTVALLLGFIEGPKWGWLSPVVLGSFAAAVALAILWITCADDAGRPLLNPGLPRILVYLGGLIVLVGILGWFLHDASVMGCAAADSTCCKPGWVSCR
jgi:hypothetical protein